MNKRNLKIYVKELEKELRNMTNQKNELIKEISFIFKISIGYK